MMARHVYFAFHYQRDISRVNVVRNHDITKNGIAQAGFYDHSLWETYRRQGDDGLKRMINSGLDGTTVTCVLVGYETASRPWVQYELQRSMARGNGLLAVRIHNIRNLTGQSDYSGVNPLDTMSYSNGVRASAYFPIYDWVNDNGYANFGLWVEQVAKIAGK